MEAVGSPREFPTCCEQSLYGKYGARCASASATTHKSVMKPRRGQRPFILKGKRGVIARSNLSRYSHNSRRWGCWDTTLRLYSLRARARNPHVAQVRHSGGACVSFHARNALSYIRVMSASTRLSK
eukprot:9485959-Pyramimonas_sp.AAC.2